MSDFFLFDDQPPESGKPQVVARIAQRRDSRRLFSNKLLPGVVRFESAPPPLRVTIAKLTEERKTIN
jgi:hypothetical protein